ncbi:CHAD domain-containing protein [Pontibacterium sp. N1Y112]|uniref:CHAD domain-containing protein n=1 Tax=Pontibacterium sinense TaxID=2781979 RepID=A0A8J7K0H5_9GAMM|nr:CHAD domain-containing protein [Pontibacterium sinense]MBE9399089.1 CHAD domain-containing protein [Pontibacterium sinense]
MAIALHTSQRLGREVHQVVDNHLKSINKILMQANAAQRDEVVHDTRTGMKRMRAFLRLLRAGIGKSAYRLADEQSKALAGNLSDNRDARVLLDTMEQLLQEIYDHECCERLRGPVFEHYHAASLDDTGLEPLEHARTCLRRLQKEARHWHLKTYDQKALRAAIAGEYDAGRQHWQQIQQQPEAEQLHRWRKQVKRFYYQFSLLFPTHQHKQRARLKMLGEYLGQLHDLAILQDYLNSHRRAFWTDDLVRLKHVSAGREQVLLEQVLQLAPKAYRQPCGSYSRKLIRRWRDLDQANS